MKDWVFVLVADVVLLLRLRLRRIAFLCLVPRAEREERWWNAKLEHGRFHGGQWVPNSEESDVYVDQLAYVLTGAPSKYSWRSPR